MIDIRNGKVCWSDGSSKSSFSNFWQTRLNGMVEKLTCEKTRKGDKTGIAVLVYPKKGVEEEELKRSLKELSEKKEVELVFCGRVRQGGPIRIEMYL